MRRREWQKCRINVSSVSHEMISIESPHGGSGVGTSSPYDAQKTRRQV